MPVGPSSYEESARISSGASGDDGAPQSSDFYQDLLTSDGWLLDGSTGPAFGGTSFDAMTYGGATGLGTSQFGDEVAHFNHATAQQDVSRLHSELLGPSSSSSAPGAAAPQPTAILTTMPSSSDTAGAAPSQPTSTLTTMPSPSDTTTAASSQASYLINQTTQVALGADVASSLYGVTGEGLKIGVISNAFNSTGGASSDIARGILPPNVTVLSDSGISDDEGRTMIEDAYAVAPGAQYLFATAGETGSDADMISAVNALKAAGANIIVDDYQVFDEPLYQTGDGIENAITSAVNSGVDYFTSAGNTGNNYHEQGFTPITTSIVDVGQVTANDFGGGSPYLPVTVGAYSNIYTLLGWAQPAASISGGAGAQNSLALYLYDGDTGHLVASSTTSMVGGDPEEFLSYYNDTGDTDFDLAVVQDGGVVPAGQLFKAIFVQSTGTPDLEGTGSGDLVGHEMLPGVNSVGAVNYKETPAFGNGPSRPESYSGSGPGEILYDANGNLLSTPITVDQPGFSAPDGTTYGSSAAITGAFNGTSAAAPAAAAVAALVLQANSALSTTQITSLLAQSTIPVVGAGYNGAGLIQARAAVEIGVADGGDRWTAAAGGDWSNGSSWSHGAAPTSAQSVSVSDNLGAFTGSYTVTVDLPGQVAGSIAISAPSGSSATLKVLGTGGLSVGGSSASNRTAGDLLTSDNGTLNVAGGRVSITGSLNNNNGSVVLTGGAVVMADNYAQNAGQLSIGGSGLPSTLTLTGGGYSQTAGTASVLAGGQITTTSLLVSDSTMTIDGLVNDSGALALTSLTYPGFIDLDAGGQLDIGGATSAGAITFETGGLLEFTSTNASVLTSQLLGTISGLGAGTGAVDFTGLTYSAQDTFTYTASTGQVEIFDPSDTELASVIINPGHNYQGQLQLQSDGLTDHIELAALCFCAGAVIATPTGDRPVESLAIGDLVMTADGQNEPVRWIGRRTYGGDLINGDRLMLPVCVKAGALSDCIPRQDLWLSPGHALSIDGQLVPAWRLINGVSVFQAETVDHVDYYHVELDRHTVLFANGAPAESFLDDGQRGQFQNVEDYHHRYPGAAAASPMASRLEAGMALQAIQRQIDLRAGVVRTNAPIGPLRGYVDQTIAGRVCGWAQDVENPEEPVRLELLIDGRPLLSLIANGYRADLRLAGVGSGLHAFDLKAPVALSGGERIEVRRAVDGAALPFTDEAKSSIKRAA